MHLILDEADRLGHLVRLRMNRYLQVELRELAHQLRVERGHGLRSEREPARAAIARLDQQSMRHEIEVDLKAALAVRNGGGREPFRRDVQCHVPGMVDPGTQRKPNFAHDLRPHVVRRVGIGPGFEGKAGPVVGRDQWLLERDAAGGASASVDPASGRNRRSLTSSTASGPRDLRRYSLKPNFSYSDKAGVFFAAVDTVSTACRHCSSAAASSSRPMPWCCRCGATTSEAMFIAPGSSSGHTLSAPMISPSSRTPKNVSSEA